MREVTEASMWREGLDSRLVAGQRVAVETEAEPGAGASYVVRNDGPLGTPESDLLVARPNSPIRRPRS